MNNTRHGDIWTSVRTRQTQPNSPTEACFRARCSASEMALLLTTTHITGMCVRETWMSVQYALNQCRTSTYLLLNPGLPVFFSAAPHSFLPSVALLCSCSRQHPKLVLFHKELCSTYVKITWNSMERRDVAYRDVPITTFHRISSNFDVNPSVTQDE